MQKPSNCTLRLALGAIALPGIALGVAAPAASAAELTPIAQYTDHTVSDTEHEAGGAIDELGLAAK